MKKLIFTLLLITLVLSSAVGQRKILNLPDLPGYVTLKCDFHLHTVFSDGNVWPTIRVGEAVRDGLDAIAITDHIEYTPHKDYIPVDHNAAWKIAQVTAKENNIILVHGAEITRKMPPGHFNALFIEDANLLVADSAWNVFEAAIKQGAFLLWNHPGWKSQQPDGIPRMYSIHHKLIKNGYLHGIEFGNDEDYYPLVLTFCKAHKLAVMCNSDNHNVMSETFAPPEFSHRPMTLVFAKEKTSESLKEALFAGRTLAYTDEILAGREEFAEPFFYQCISVGKPYLENEKSIFFEVTNKSDIPFYLVNGPAGATPSITLAPNSVTRVVLSKKVTAPLIYDVKNVMTGENEVLKVELKY
ncbi:MAG: Sb-PDE family phosphodiesterase [Bacteroidales bacterium]|nr:Sb-PDE family phosphodiesterase [Bacteroidales bacterium]